MSAAKIRRRVTLAGLLGGLALAAVAGVAYAGSDPVETGWATIVDGTQDCPETGGGSAGPGLEQGPEQGEL